MAPRGERYAVQDRLYAALERLETKDTQHAAVLELQRLIREMEPPVLSTLLHAAGTHTAKTSQFSRRHCLALAATACTPQGCPHWRAMLEPPLLGKLLGLLGRALRDGDAAVRSAAAEGLGTVAAQLAAANPGADATSGTPANPLLACILEALGEPGAGVQAAAAQAVAQAADHLGPLDPALLRLLLTALSNPLCGGRAELCGALARLEGGRVGGLVTSSFQQVLAAWPEVLGSAADGAGLLGVLGSKGKDFGARAAAAGALKALAAGVGPQAPGWDAAAAALKAAKTDISKPVRDAAAGALPLVAGLLEFVANGAPPEQWPAVCGSLLVAETGGGKRAAASTLQQLQLHLSSVSAGVAALAASSSSSGGSGGDHAQAIQAHLASVNAGVAALAVGVGGAQQMLASVGACGPAAALIDTTCCSPTTATGSPGSAATSCPKRLSSLHRSYNALERELLVAQQQGACLPGSPTAVLTSPTAAQPSAGPGPDHPTTASAAPTASDWEAVYAQLLGGSGGVATDQQAQLKLLRCMARSGPVWEQLSPATGQRLMQAIAAFLQEGTALKRLLPLLWPLADSATRASRAAATYPPTLRQQLLAALAAYPLPAAGQQQGEAQGQGSEVVPDGTSSACDPLAEKRELLLSALRAVWD